jgi:hypothetical protein
MHAPGNLRTPYASEWARSNHTSTPVHSRDEFGRSWRH